MESLEHRPLASGLADAGGLSARGIVRSATVTTLDASVAAAVFGRSVTFAATVSVVAGGGGTPTGTVTFRDTFDGTTATLGTATLSGPVGHDRAVLTTATLVPGVHTITATYDGSVYYNPSTSAGLSETVDRGTDVTTYHLDAARNGYVTGFVGEPGGSTWGRYATVDVDGTAVRGAPLVLAGHRLPDGSTHTLVLVATSGNTVAAYAEDELHVAGSSAVPLWEDSLGPPSLAPAGYSPSDAPVGIWSTPVIDPAAGRLYVVADQADGPDGPGFYAYAIDVDTGSILSRALLHDAGASGRPTFNGTNGAQDQRGALNLVNGWIYAVFATAMPEDRNPDYHGWLVGIDAADLSRQVFLPTTTTGGYGTGPTGYLLGGGVLGPGGAVADGTGTLYLETGNAEMNGLPVNSNPHAPSESAYYAQFDPGGRFAGRHPGDLGDHFEDFLAIGVRSDGSLFAKDYWTPGDQRTINDHDQDFGGSSPLVLPDGLLGHDLMVGTAKTGNVYLLDCGNAGANLGGFNGTGLLADVHVYRAGPNIPTGGSKIAPAYLHTDAGDDVFVDGDGAPGLVAFRIVMSAETGKPTLQEVWMAHSDTVPAGSYASGWYSPGSPVVTVGTDGRALVWVPELPINGASSGILEAFDAVTGSLVWRSNDVPDDAPGPLPHFPALTATRTSLYLGTQTGFVAYGDKG